MRKNNVLIVDDQAMPRQLFESIVENSENYKLVASIDSASIADVYCSVGNIDLIIMDVVMADGISGLEASSRIKKSYPSIKILMVTSMPDGTFIERARKIGVDSFWYKEVQDAPLLAVMDKTMAGERIYPECAPVMKLGNSRTTEFTAREFDVLRQIAAGYTDKEIAEHMQLSYHTVRAHINSLLQKTGCTSRTDLAIRTAKSGIVVPEV